MKERLLKLIVTKTALASIGTIIVGLGMWISNEDPGNLDIMAALSVLAVCIRDAIMKSDAS